MGTDWRGGRGGGDCAYVCVYLCAHWMGGQCAGWVGGWGGAEKSLTFSGRVREKEGGQRGTEDGILSLSVLLSLSQHDLAVHSLFYYLHLFFSFSLIRRVHMWLGCPPTHPSPPQEKSLLVTTQQAVSAPSNPVAAPFCRSPPDTEQKKTKQMH